MVVRSMPTIPVLKVLIVGDGNVGKTSLVRRYCQGMFSESRIATIGVDFQTQMVSLPQGAVKLSIWDLAGQERFSVMRPGFYKGARSTAMIYDVTDSSSFEDLPRWQKEVLDVVPNQPLVLIGNKTDLPRTLPAEAARAYAESIGARYLETSAATGEGVPQMFETLARLARGLAAAG
jgi:small GTP-binding protein